MTEKILIVDDEPEMLQTLGRILSRKGYAVYTAEGGKEACKAMEETVFDLVISDMAMEDLNGLELLKIIRATDSITPFIMMTGVGTIESAVEAIQIGAFHYITKPFKNHDIEILAQRAIEYGKLNRKLIDINLSDEREDLPRMLIGASKSMHELMKRVEKISDSMASVLIMGETGTGKSVLAERIHRKSSRRDNPFLTIDCAALTETLLESELFGHVKGAFTGAVQAKRGLLEEAQGGTVFLDEICEIKPSTQVKLLRAVQDGIIKPVGGNHTVKIDVRFISASSRDLHGGVSSGQFREELYYRLAVVPLFLPPLRERREDITLLIDFFLDKFCRKYNKKISRINADVLEMLVNASWKGNIRELANIIERSVLLSENEVITPDCLLNSAEMQRIALLKAGERNDALPLKQVVEEAEKRAIAMAFKTSKNNRTEAARILGISRRALYDKLAAYSLYDLEPDSDAPENSITRME
ncbi:MAG: sigma-54-dependent Fis family transcriptional regulator [Deltaproteobacteria bacterium]|nr:sigma-54-dependent Fis family transcriptional regulator [Deltaproteobacteria bacterium]